MFLSDTTAYFQYVIYCGQFVFRFSLYLDFLCEKKGAF